MADNSPLVTIKDTLTKANDIYVLLPQNPTLDMVAAGLSMYLNLQSMGKNVYIACPQEMRAEFSRLIGIDKVVDTIGNRNLVISLAVSDQGSIDKVSYNLDEEGKNFNLVIQPKSGTAPLKTEDVSFSYAGASAEVVFMIGVNRFEDLGHFYQDERKLFSEALTINVTRFPSSGTVSINYADATASSLSEIAFRLCKDLGIEEINKDAATNMLSGIDAATNQLQHPMLKATTFEVVANLMKAGGIRQIANTAAQAFPQRNPFMPDAPVTTTPKMVVPKAVMPAPAPSGEADNQDIPAPKEVPQEWLTPKIYKAGGSNTNNNNPNKI